MLAVETGDLCKRYGRRDVLQRVALQVPDGSLFGLLGPNGAGKTTTIRILLGLLRASSGHARVNGLDAWRCGAAARAEVGYLPGDVHLYEHMCGKSLLEFLNAARGGRSMPEAQRLARRFELDLEKRIRAYSRGMKQKLGLIQAMMHRPRLLILDEPTTALDPLVRQVFFEELREVAAAGRTVLFSSHTLGEVAELCDRVAILRDGMLIEQDKIDVLRSRALRRVEIAFRPGAAALATAPAGLAVQGRVGDRWMAAWTGPVGPLLAWLSTCDVADVTIGAPDLEDLFLAYYTGPVAGGTA